MIQRTIEKHISSLMNEYFSVSIFGPRQCGKTTLAKNLFPSFSYANLEDMNVRSLAKNDPEEFFTRFPEPVIIDEIQRVPELLSTVQVRIDKNQKKGQYLITGSQQISLKSSITQSLAGRTAIVQMLPLSISELYSANIKLDRDSQLVSGFMPFLYAESGHSPFEYYKNYVNTYLERDIVQIAAVHDLIRFEKFMRLLAGRVGQLVNNSILATEVGVSSTTIGSWLSVLEASHVIYTLKPWFKNRNSQVVIAVSLRDGCLLFLIDDFTTSSAKNGRNAFLHKIEMIRAEISTGRVFSYDTHLATLCRRCCYYQGIRIRLACGTESDTGSAKSGSDTIEIQIGRCLRQGVKRIFTITLRTQQTTFFGSNGYEYDRATLLDRQFLELLGDEDQRCPPCGKVVVKVLLDSFCHNIC